MFVVSCPDGSFIYNYLCVVLGPDGSDLAVYKCLSVV